MLKDLLLASRSYRSFDESVKISDEMLADWVDHARYAPSSINLQMLKFVSVTDAFLCARVLENTRWAGKITDIKLPPLGHAPVAYVVICADTNIVPYPERFDKDVGICAQTIMLAAAESGFGGCMIGSFTPDAIKELLELGENLVALHIHDNDGREDQHNAPYVGGILQWDRFIRGLKNSGYKGNLSFETGGATARYPKPLLIPALNMLGETAKYFRDEIMRKD